MKKLLISLLVLLVLIGGGWFVLTTVVIDSTAIGKRLSRALEEATGRKVEISLKGDVQLFPLPQVTYKTLTVGNLEGASSAKFIDSSNVTLKLSISSLLTGSAEPSEVILNAPSIDFEVLPGEKKNWQFTGSSDGFQKYFVDTPVKLNKGVIRYVNAVTGTRAQLRDITGVLRYDEAGKVVVFNGDVNLHGHNSQVMARMNSVDLTSANVPDVPFQLAIEHTGAQLTAQGRLSSANTDPEFIGQVTVEAKNLWSVIGLVTGNQPVSVVSDTAENTVTAKGNIHFSNHRIKLEKMKVDAKGDSSIPALDGTLDLEYGFGKKSVLNIDADFGTVDMDHLMASYTKWYFVDPTLKAQKEEQAQSELDVAEKDENEKFSDVLERLNGNIDVQIDSIVYNGRSLSDIRLLSVIRPGRMLIRQGKVILPGKTKVIFSGEVRNKLEGLTYDGKYEMQGQEMDQFLSLFMPKDAEMPAINLGRFGVRTNLSISPKQFRFSEFQAIVADTRMAGSMIFHRGDRLKLESYLRVAHINLDTVTKAARYMLPEDEGVKKNTTGESGEELFDVQYLNTRFAWLSTVGMDIDADFYLQDFVLWERKGELAKFNLDVGVGEIIFTNMNARYNSADIKGSYGLRVQAGANPQFVVNGSISELNMVDFFPNLAHSRSADEWQAYLDNPMELLELQTYRADAALQVGKLNIRNYTFENAKIELLMENNVLNVDRFDAKLWDGTVNSRFRIQAGTIPSLSTSFRIQNANLVRLSESTALLKHAAGRTALSGQLNTSGISLRSWYNNVQGEMRIMARDVSVQGFGIANLARAVPVARTVNDVERAAKIATNGGVTRMSEIEGIINVLQGEASIPQMRFESPEAKGTVEGKVDLIDETIDLHMNFYLLNTVKAGEETPTIRLNMFGSIDDVKKDLETRELKNYIAKKAAKRALGRGD